MATDRRGFLTGMAAMMGASALQRTLSAPILRALSLPGASRYGDLRDIEHIVIFMQENRSFDHYFGTLRGVRGFGDPRPIPLPSGKSVFHQPWLGGSEVLPFHFDSRQSGALCQQSLDHSWKGSQIVWRNHDAWAWLKTPLCMGYFMRQDIPFYYALADAFTLCDGYHASMQGPTDPNRLYLFSGTSGQTVTNVDDGNWTADMANDSPLFSGYRWTATAERLTRAGIRWQVYQEYDNYGDNALAYFKAFRKLDRQSDAWRRARSIVPGSTRDNAVASDGRYLVQAFARDVQSGQLPQVSWIVAPQRLCEHPANSPALGEWLTARLLAALVANPAVWARTAFFITYDENDGFFDHMPCPVPALHAGQGQSTVSVGGERYLGTPIGLGVRVPMLVVSPWSKGGWVCSEQFDHTSVLRLIERRFGIEESNISPWRRTVTGDLTSAFDFSHTDLSWPSLPDPADYQSSAAASCRLPAPSTPSQPSMPRQEPGRRLSRALPYRLACHGVAADAGRSLTLDFINHGDTGASMIVYAPSRVDGPWHYTLGPRTKLTDTWHQDDDYWYGVHGPNGFVREFAGDVGDPLLELRVHEDPLLRMLRLVLIHHSGTPCTVVIAAAGDAGPPRRVALAERAWREVHWDVRGRDDWYDLSLSLVERPRWHRRLAGRVETGRHGLSDPGVNGG
ncbi:phosphocholine-specific phospholipase C [Paludibacterium sp.]|uniref:phosphocholine-specific phospholipase C n=1 Tax=Paludibacterium sp. TaxID=1917523 RepID=UPI0025F4C735|nr:phospholipase C, phosphocholine-specific [Paludibacterium sp.]MBV8646866.1 phospholipase C, phosphocholine-specific [Paludibacterium sp.]